MGIEKTIPLSRSAATGRHSAATHLDDSRELEETRECLQTHLADLRVFS